MPAACRAGLASNNTGLVSAMGCQVGASAAAGALAAAHMNADLAAADTEAAPACAAPCTLADRLPIGHAS